MPFFLYICILVILDLSHLCMIYLYPCLCRAFMPVYLFIYLFIYLCWSPWECATPFGLWVGHGIVVLCALVLECVCCHLWPVPSSRSGKSFYVDHFDRGFIPL